MTASTRNLRLGIYGGILLLVIVCILVNYIAARHFKRFDLTEKRYFSLGRLSRNLVSGLTQPIRIYASFNRDTFPAYQHALELLRQYEQTSTLLALEVVDPVVQHHRFKELANKYALPEENAIVVENEAGRNKLLTEADLIRLDYTTAATKGMPTISSYRIEEQVTRAIVELVQGKKTPLYVSTGHQELSTSNTAPEGLSRLVEYLTQSNFEITPYRLAEGRLLPAGAILLLLGPKLELMEAEIITLQRFLDQGGRLLVCLDPLFNEDITAFKPSSLQEMLSQYGPAFADNLVIQTDYFSTFYGPTTVYTAEYGKADMVKELAGAPVIFSYVRSIEQATRSECRWQALVFSGKDSWGETHAASLEAGCRYDPGVDQQGPLCIAAVCGKEPWRIVAFGSSSFLTNAMIDSGMNRKLAFHAIGGLKDEDPMYHIAMHKVDRVVFHATSGQLVAISLVILVGMPFLCLAGGVLVWWRRRK